MPKGFCHLRPISAPPVPQPWHAAPSAYVGGDLEQPGVFEAALAARAPAKEVIFLSVGDTRDHRRQYKDPALRTSALAVESIPTTPSRCVPCCEVGTPLANTLLSCRPPP